MNFKTEIEEIEKRFDEKYANQCGKGWGCDNCGACYNEAVDRDDAKAFFRAELPALLSKFVGEVNGEEKGRVITNVGSPNPEWQLQAWLLKAGNDGWNSHHRSVAEKAEEIIKRINQ